MSVSHMQVVFTDETRLLWAVSTAYAFVPELAVKAAVTNPKVTQ